MWLIYVLAAVAAIYIVYSISNKKPAADPLFLRKRCPSCNTLCDISLIRCPACVIGKLPDTPIVMSEREQQGFFLDKYIHPHNDNDEDDISIQSMFEYLDVCVMKDDPYNKTLPQEVRELRANARKELAKYRQAVETFAVKPTWHELNEELKRREKEYLEQEVALVKKIGYIDPDKKLLQPDDLPPDLLAVFNQQDLETRDVLLVETEKSAKWKLEHLQKRAMPEHAREYLQLSDLPPELLTKYERSSAQRKLSILAHNWVAEGKKDIAIRLVELWP